MNRSIVAALGLLACGSAAGQSSGDLTLIGAPGTVEVMPMTPVTVIPGDFQVFSQPVQVFIIADFSSMIGAGMHQADQREDLLLDRAHLHGEPVLLTVEGDGVRLPDQRLDTIKP